MKLVKAYENAELVIGPSKSKESKWAGKAREKNKRDIGAYKIKTLVATLSHWGKGWNGRTERGPAGVSHYGRNNK